MNWRAAFSLRKSDRRVLLVLLALLVVAFAVLLLLDASPAAETAVSAVQDSLVHKNEDGKLIIEDGTTCSHHQSYQVDSPVPERFVFDPNTADSTQLLRLGLQPWQVRNIYKYRAAGGIYRRKEDFARLYGLTVKQYRELEPYISISEDYQPAATLIKKEEEHHDTGNDTLQPVLRYPVKIAEGETVDLNCGDTAVYRQVPGIGRYFARRIADYRQRLGGYVSVSQLDEIDDFPLEAKKYFVVDHVQPQRLMINRLSLNQLKRHPYINFYQAKAIVDRRRLDGPLHDLDALRGSRDFSEEEIRRLTPYVDYSE